MTPSNADLSPRRRDILTAATTVLARQGNRGLTHRAVDREAGIPEGSSSAYFRTRDALLGALGDFVADRMAVDVEALGVRLAGCPGDHERAVAEVSRLFSRWLDEPDLLTARLELTVAATRDPGLAARFTQWRDDLVAMVREVLAAAAVTGEQGGGPQQGRGVCAHEIRERLVPSRHPCLPPAPSCARRARGPASGVAAAQP